MQLVERYQELIERDPNEISILWKSLQMLFYLTSAVAGYVTTYAFSMFQDLLHHRCILWAVPRLGRFSRMNYFLRRSMNETVNHRAEQPWEERLEIKFMSEYHCSSILMISIISCACGLIGFTFFSICGRGGYQAREYYESWRLVVPALFVNFCLSLLCLETACDFDHGFQSFQDSLNKIVNQSGIEPVMTYLESRTKNPDSHRYTWKYIQVTKISAWIGAGAWILGFVLLILRVVNVTDFRLLKVSVYASPKTRADELQKKSPSSEPEA